MVMTALMSAGTAWGQQVVSPDGSMASKDNLHMEKVSTPWKLEVSVRQVVSIGYIPELATIGLRKGNRVFGLGAGHSMMTYDAHPVTVYSIPFYAYTRRYFPMGANGRFSFYTDEFLGYETVYKVLGDTTRYNGSKKGDGHFLLYWQPGISLRMWGKSNLFLGFTLAADLKYIYSSMVGLHLGLAL